MARGPWRSFMPPSRCDAASLNASRWPKHTKKKPAKPRSLIQTSRKTLKKFSATASRGTRQRGNSPRLQRHYRCRTQRPYRSGNPRTSEGGSGRDRNRLVGGDHRRAGAWCLSHENPSAATATLGVHRATVERRAGASRDARHRATSRAHRRPTGSDRRPVCVRGFADWCDGLASWLRSRDAEPPRFPENPWSVSDPTLNEAPRGTPLSDEDVAVIQTAENVRQVRRRHLPQLGLNLDNYIQ